MLEQSPDALAVISMTAVQLAGTPVLVCREDLRDRCIGLASLNSLNDTLAASVSEAPG